MASSASAPAPSSPEPKSGGGKPLDLDIDRITLKDVRARLKDEQGGIDGELVLDSLSTGRIANVGGWEVDLLSGTITFTDQLCRIHDKEPGYTPTYEEAVAFYPPEARSLIHAAVEAGRLHGVPWDLELPFVTAKGRSIWVRSRGLKLTAPICPNGKWTGTTIAALVMARFSKSVRSMESRYGFGERQ